MEKLSLIRSTSFDLAQTTSHGFRNTVLNSYWYRLRNMQQKKPHLYVYYMPDNTFELYVFTKSIDTSRPALSVQADMDQKFS